MRRPLQPLLWAALTFVPVMPALPAAAQSAVSGGASASAEYTDNATLAPDGSPKTTDTIYTIRPSLAAKSEMRGMEASLAYTLTYWHFQKSSSLDRALHDLAAKAELTWWENIDLEASEDLIPVPIDFGAPVDNPVNDAQSSHTAGKVAYVHEFDALTRLRAGYQGEYVDWLLVNSATPALPTYVIHGPGVGVTRDIGKLGSVEVEYRYRLQHFLGSYIPAAGDLTAHVLAVHPRYSPSDWMELSGALGVQLVSFQNASSATRTLFDAEVRMGGDPGRLTATLDRHLTEDINGNAADQTMASLKGEYTPFARWGVGVTAAYGDLSLVAGSATAFGELSFLQYGGSLDFTFPNGPQTYHLSVGGTHHQSLGSSGSPPQLEVNRVSLLLGGEF